MVVFKNPPYRALQFTKGKISNRKAAYKTAIEISGELFSESFAQGCFTWATDVLYMASQVARCSDAILQ